MRSPTGVALQGTLALFSIHGVLGFGSSMRGERERGTMFLFFLIIIIFLFYFICGDSKMGYNNGDNIDYMSLLTRPRIYIYIMLGWYYLSSFVSIYNLDVKKYADQFV